MMTEVLGSWDSGRIRSGALHQGSLKTNEINYFYKLKERGFVTLRFIHEILNTFFMELDQEVFFYTFMECVST